MATVTTQHVVPAQMIADETRPFLVGLHYDTADPLAVRVVFPAEAALDGVETSWFFARELLATGVDRPTGTGSVRLWPRGEGTVFLELQAPEGVAVVDLSAIAVREFLRESYELLSAEAEASVSEVDIERELAELLHRS
ncbi:SsgA family sporulation/cell division regulator [Streptomyces sp. XM4193]|uniref:SsgA family sporulation/cell division regulator n=1 Tax=Streptomyces sp. XM4193 TaxID=2929782 RepID=UPI001FF8844E|nr:SsgA family sporulation/cell division regulator [Streptomyces sp. XM4193]MCK1796822.1 SsgA family sporulation/cell division regulator [Streptomyces sp. XM4193]